MTEYTQHLMREGEYTRKALWSKASRKSVDEWRETSAEYRKMFADEVDRPLRDRPPAAQAAQPQSLRRGRSTPATKWCSTSFPTCSLTAFCSCPRTSSRASSGRWWSASTGWKAGRKTWPIPRSNSPYYNQFAIRLAERGFITFSPQNPYIFTDRFRTLQRKSNPLRKTLFSTIVPQHQQIVDWLASLPMVDPKRIGFYGLSYGGKTAMRIPALVERYCLSICSADFNEWIWKNTSTRCTVQLHWHGRV